MGKKQETGITGVENNINLEKNSNIIKRIVVFMFMFALSGVIAWLGSVLYHIQTDMMIRNIVMVLTGSGIVIFSYVMGETSGFFVYRNEGRYGRFAFIYLVSLTAAVFLPFLPVTGWPFLVLFVLLSVFSNSIFDAERAYIGTATVGVIVCGLSDVFVISNLVSSTFSSVFGTKLVITALNPISSDSLST